jgi:hypothetical protein
MMLGQILFRPPCSGACWTTRFLAQIGLEFIALDVSDEALRLGRQVIERQPMLGDVTPPRFLPFESGSRVRHATLWKLLPELALDVGWPIAAEQPRAV